MSSVIFFLQYIPS